MAGRRLLLFRDLKDQTGKGNENKKQLKQFFICNSIHFVTPFPSGQGAKKDHPLKEGDNRLPCYGSARFSKEPHLFYQNVT